MRPWQAAVKRLMDIGLGLIALVILSPISVLVGLAVVLDSTGPVFHGARRVGRHGTPFTMWKFRSMVSSAASIGPPVTGAFDPRVTRVGAFLRRTRLDELPQFVNVVLGQMALVGPRPEAPVYVDLWSQAEREVLTIRPGITGPTQVAYFDEETTLMGHVDEAYERDVMHAKLAVDLNMSGASASAAICGSFGER